MRPSISIRGCVCPSVRMSVRYQFRLRTSDASYCPPGLVFLFIYLFFFAVYAPFLVSLFRPFSCFLKNFQKTLHSPYSAVCKHSIFQMLHKMHIPNSHLPSFLTFSEDAKWIRAGNPPCPPSHVAANHPPST